MEKIFESKELVSQLNDKGGYFIDFVTTKDIEAGIICLHPGEKDLQEPHSVDEIYYVIEGFAYIEIEGRSKAIKERDIIFIPAKSRHRFHGNNQDLVVLYVLGRWYKIKELYYIITSNQSQRMENKYDDSHHIFLIKGSVYTYELYLAMQVYDK